MNRYDVKIVSEFLNDDVAPDYLTEILDDAMYNIAAATVRHTDEVMLGSVEDQLYYLRRLRNLFCEVHKSNVPQNAAATC